MLKKKELFSMIKKPTFFLITFLFLFIFSSLDSKVLIFTHVYNRPDFIELQYLTFKKFLEDEYEFIVFSDACNQHMMYAIKNTCKRLNIKHIPIPQHIHKIPYLKRWPKEKFNAPAVRNVNAVMYSLNTLGFEHDDILVLLDSDVFFLKKISIKELLKDHDIVGMRLGNGFITYLWHGLIFLNMKTLPDIKTLDFNCGRVNDKPVDAGGHSYYYLNEHPELVIKYVDYIHTGQLFCKTCKKTNSALCNHNTNSLKEKGFDDALIKLIQSAPNIEFFHQNSIIHYRGGTNWDNKSQRYHQNKIDALSHYIDHIINQ